MTSKSVAFLLADLGVTKTHAWPHVSNDNPFSEAQFKTLKYRPDFPERFGAIQDARAHCHVFFVLIDRFRFMRPALWSVRGARQVYLTTLLNHPLGDGPALTVATEVPDRHHFRGSYGGRVNAMNPKPLSGPIAPKAIARRHAHAEAFQEGRESGLTSLLSCYPYCSGLGAGSLLSAEEADPAALPVYFQGSDREEPAIARRKTSGPPRHHALTPEQLAVRSAVLRFQVRLRSPSDMTSDEHRTFCSLLGRARRAFPSVGAVQQIREPARISATSPGIILFLDQLVEALTRRRWDIPTVSDLPPDDLRRREFHRRCAFFERLHPNVKRGETQPEWDHIARDLGVQAPRVPTGPRMTNVSISAPLGVPLEWTHGKILKHKRKFDKAIASGQPVACEVQYPDGSRKVEHRIFKPMEIPSTTSVSRRRGGSQPKISPQDWEAHEHAFPGTLSDAQRARILTTRLGRPVSRSTVLRARQRAQARTRRKQ